LIDIEPYYVFDYFKLIKRGETSLKKWFFIGFFAFLLFAVGSPALAAETTEVDEALQFIEETNLEIDKKVEQAVEKADQLRSAYLQDIRTMEEESNLLPLIEEQNRLTNEVEQLQEGDLNAAALTEKIAEIEITIQEEQTRINNNLAIIENILEVAGARLSDDVDNVKELEAQLRNLVGTLTGDYETYLPRTLQYHQDLDTLITDIFNETLNLSAIAIEEAAKVGIVAECSWDYIQFADRWVWIDPVRVVKM